MFTGIVQTMGKIVATTPTAAGKRLVIDRGAWAPSSGRAIGDGDSICVNGVCLTVAGLDGPSLHFDVIGETLAKTTLGTLRPGDAVNLEPSVTSDTPMSGHFVQGHVEGVGIVTRVQRQDSDIRLAIEPPAALMPYIIPKGSIALDGVSMTVAAVYERDFEVALIPTTLAATTLGRAAQDTRLNLETDILSRTVVHTLKHIQGRSSRSAITREFLSNAGLAS